MDKPRVRLAGYDSSKYCVLVCRMSGEVFIAWAGTYKPQAFKEAVKYSRSRDTSTYLDCIIRPGTSLLEAVNYVIRGWSPIYAGKEQS